MESPASMACQVIISTTFKINSNRHDQGWEEKVAKEANPLPGKFPCSRAPFSSNASQAGAEWLSVQVHRELRRSDNGASGQCQKFIEA